MGGLFRRYRELRLGCGGTSRPERGFVQAFADRFKGRLAARGAGSQPRGGQPQLRVALIVAVVGATAAASASAGGLGVASSSAHNAVTSSVR